MNFVNGLVVASFLMLPGLAFSKVGAGGATVTEYARIDWKSVNCSVSATSASGTTGNVASLTVTGSSERPKIWDKATDFWMDISNEPLFIFTPGSGGNVSGDVNVLVTHAQYNEPSITEVMSAAASIGSSPDVPFEFKYRLTNYDGKSAVKRDIKINGLKICSVRFDPRGRSWSVK